MTSQNPFLYDEFDDLPGDVEELEQASEDDLWFLPGPMEEEPDYLPPGPRAEPRETAILDDWLKSEAASAARLGRVAGRIGALDDRLRRGPEGWRHRLALIEAADLSWFVGDRVGPDRLALWMSMRLSGVQVARGSGSPVARERIRSTSRGIRKAFAPSTSLLASRRQVEACWKTLTPQVAAIVSMMRLLFFQSFCALERPAVKSQLFL